MSALNGCELAVLFLYHLPATGTYYMWHRADIRWVENMEIRYPAEKRATAEGPVRWPHTFRTITFAANSKFSTLTVVIRVE